MPPPININNVPLNYFLHGVDAMRDVQNVQPPGSAGVQPADRFVEPGCRLYVAHDGGTASWRVVSGDGEVLDDADDWASLAARLDAAMPEEEDVVFLP